MDEFQAEQDGVAGRLVPEHWELVANKMSVQGESLLGDWIFWEVNDGKCFESIKVDSQGHSDNLYSSM